MHEYGTARATGKFIAFIGWLVVALGTILLFVAFSTMRSGLGFLALAPSIGIVVGGLLLVCQGQMAQALVDIARNTSLLVQSMHKNTIPNQQASPKIAVDRPNDLSSKANVLPDVSYADKACRNLIVESLKKKYGVSASNLDLIMTYWLGMVNNTTEAQAAQDRNEIVLLNDGDEQQHCFEAVAVVKMIAEKHQGRTTTNSA
jgi:hypothetical protein